jgi:thioredoxin
MSDITVHELHKLMQSGSVELIDVRTGMEFRSGHAVGARHVPLGSLDPAKVLAERTAAKDAPLYVICASGGRSASACDAFRRAGFTQAVNVVGGTGAWNRAGLPMERDAQAARWNLLRQVAIIAVVAGAVLFLMPCSPFPVWGAAYCPTTPAGGTAASAVDFERDVIAASMQVPVLVDFHATWCPPCKALAPEIAALQQERGDRLRVVQIDVDREPELTQRHGVQGIPDVRLFVAGREAARFTGFRDRAEIAAWIDYAVQR